MDRRDAATSVLMLNLKKLLSDLEKFLFNWRNFLLICKTKFIRKNVFETFFIVVIIRPSLVVKSRECCFT